MISRRQFMKDSGQITMIFGLAGIAPFLEGCAGTKFITATETEGMLTVKSSDFDGVKYIMIETDQLKDPILITALGENGHMALLMKCTHKGCRVKPQGEEIVCGCHGSRFDYMGKVTKRPAAAPLTRYRVMVDGDNVNILLK